MKRELPDVQAEFSKGKRSRDQIANISWMKKALLSLHGKQMGKQWKQ